MPGTDVGIARNGPPVAVPGFGSQLSSWLRPPDMLNTTIRFWSDFNCAAMTGLEKMPRPPAQALAPTAASDPINCRRAIVCSGDLQAYLASMAMLSCRLVVEPKFGRVQEGP